MANAALLAQNILVNSRLVREVNWHHCWRWKITMEGL